MTRPTCPRPGCTQYWCCSVHNTVHSHDVATVTGAASATGWWLQCSLLRRRLTSLTTAPQRRLAGCCTILSEPSNQPVTAHRRHNVRIIADLRSVAHRVGASRTLPMSVCSFAVPRQRSHRVVAPAGMSSVRVRQTNDRPTSCRPRSFDRDNSIL